MICFNTRGFAHLQSLNNFQLIIKLVFINQTQHNHKKMNNKAASDYNYKIVLLGDSGVGKSNIISRFTKN